MVHLSTLLAGVVGLVTVVSAHPGHDVKIEAAERAVALKGMRARGLSQCTTTLKDRGVEAANVARRDSMLRDIRKKRGLTGPVLKARDTAPLSTSHASDLAVDFDTDPSELFASGGTCVLAEDVTQGPYYVSGELIREDLTEDQEGVPLYFDIQLIDSNSCEVVPDVYIDFWHCNSTGVYSGVVAGGNGNSADESNIDTTFLRGLQKTDSLGVAQFETLFPGHYTGRATHIHVLSHPNGTTANTNNDTLSGLYTASSSHVGQIFFDQDLISLVEETAVYLTNTQQLTTNAEDSILLQELDDDIDPFIEYVLLGEDVSDGIFGWVNVVVDSTKSTDVSPAVYYTEDGGVVNENSSGGPGGAPSS
ncbi:Intradiol ring-cleavage dioxygenase [Aspergillus varians]